VSDLKKAGLCAGWNLYTLRKNPRFYLALIMGFLLCWMLTDKTLRISRDFQTDLQAFEAFIPMWFAPEEIRITHHL